MSSARGLGHAPDDEALALRLELCLPRLLVVSRTRGCVRRCAGFRPESWFAGPARTILRLLSAGEARLGLRLPALVFLADPQPSADLVHEAHSASLRCFAGCFADHSVVEHERRSRLLQRRDPSSRTRRARFSPGSAACSSLAATFTASPVTRGTAFRVTAPRRRFRCSHRSSARGSHRKSPRASSASRVPREVHAPRDPPVPRRTELAWL